MNATKTIRRTLTATATAATAALLLTPATAFAADGTAGPGAPKPPAPTSPNPKPTHPKAPTKPTGPVQTTTKISVPKLPTAAKAMTLSAHVSPAHRAAPGSPAETGTVTFTVDGTTGAPIAVKAAKAAERIKLTAGKHTVDAKYSGDPTHVASDSGPVTVTVS